MEQGNCLDSTLMSARQEVDVRSGDEPALDAAITRLLTAEPNGDSGIGSAPRSARAEVSPELERMVVEWVALTERQNTESLSDEEGDAISARWSELQQQICCFRARNLAELCAKAPIYRYERDDERDTTKGETSMMFRAWESMVQDIEALSTALTPALDLDPMLPMIEEGRHLLKAVDTAFAESADAHDDDPRFIARGALHDELWSHIDSTILKTVPHTAVGCRELARFAGEYFQSQGVPITDDDQAIAGLIAQSPLLLGEAEQIGGLDDELLALGREFDAIHAAWVPAMLAQGRAEKKAHAVFEDLERRKGWTRADAHEASWAEPGLIEAAEGGNAITLRMEKVQASIRALPARTLDGLAVKARAAIPGVWTRGEYQEDAGLGDDEDWIELNARSVIDECLHLAGVDWTGRRYRPSSRLAREEAITSGADEPILTPKTSAKAVNLTDLGIGELHALYETTGAVREMWTGAMCLPLAVSEEHPNGSVIRSPFGRLANFEDERLGFLRDRIASEAASRTPAGKYDRDSLLSLRIQQEIACEGRILNPALLADIAQAWG